MYIERWDREDMGGGARLWKEALSYVVYVIPQISKRYFEYK
jgi:hypothetical protein